jgi:LysR family transcriptional regulator, low CO2-responsive transcriptional regulator
MKEILNIFPHVKEKLNPVLRRVTLKQLRVLAAVVRSGRVTGAADALGVTPPAASLQLRQLEETFQVALVERAADGVRPTDAGREVLAAAERVEAALGECADAIAALRGIEGGRVAVGVISTAKYFAPRALAAFKRAHPNVEMRVLVGNRRETLAALEAFELDLAVMGRPPEAFEVERAVLGDHPHVIIAAPDHPAVGRERVALADLAGEEFLLRESGSGTRILTERLFAEAGLGPPAGAELGSNETIKQAVMAGMGVALLSAHTVAAEARDGRLAVLDVEGLPAVRQWFVVKRREKRLLPAARALWDHLARSGGDYLPDTSTFLPRRRAGEGPA